ncbi:MAG TPA: hypothetical protein PLA90_14950 [Candidatus Sumerlaeota bacterium]|nr:hypothetical protein [Candidatus Sumerlaeota bacterium]
MVLQGNACGTKGCSRRCFLKASAGLALAASAGGCQSFFRGKTDEVVVANADPALGEYVDLSSLRPRPKVRILTAVVREKPPYWLGWPGTSYDVEGHRKEYGQTFQTIGQKLGVTIEEASDPLETDEAAERFTARIKAEKPDAVLLHVQHIYSWPRVHAISKSGVPTLIFAPVGTGFTQDVLDISRRPGILVISSLEPIGVEQAMRAVRAKRQMEESRMLVLKGDERSETALELLGTRIRYAPRSLLNDTFARMPVTDEARQVARQMRRGALRVVEPTSADLIHAARSYMTAKRLMRDEAANGITTDCLGMVTSKLVPTPPCMAATLFQDAGVTYGCEADLNAALSLMLVSYLFDKPGFMNDPVPETVKNRLVAAHCSSATRLYGFNKPAEPYALRSHSESNIGVALQVLWRVGQPVTLLLFQGPKEVILDTGTVAANVDTPPAGGCRTSMELVMDRIQDVRDVKGFHQVVFYGNHRRDVEAFCQLYGIRVVNSPEKPPRKDPA